MRAEATRCGCATARSTRWPSTHPEFVCGINGAFLAGLLEGAAELTSLESSVPLTPANRVLRGDPSTTYATMARMTDEPVVGSGHRPAAARRRLRRHGLLRLGDPAGPPYRAGNHRDRDRDRAATPGGAAHRRRPHRCRRPCPRSGLPRRPPASRRRCRRGRPAAPPAGPAAARRRPGAGDRRGAGRVSTPASPRSGGATSTGSATSRPSSTRCAGARSCAWPRRLDEARDERGSGQQLLGEHDFATFCKRREGATTIRTLQQLSWRASRCDDRRHGRRGRVLSQHGARPGRCAGRRRRGPPAADVAGEALGRAHPRGDSTVYRRAGSPSKRSATRRRRLRWRRARTPAPGDRARTSSGSTRERSLLQRRAVSTERRQRVSLVGVGARTWSSTPPRACLPPDGSTSAPGAAARGTASRRHDGDLPRSRMRLRRDRLRAGGRVRQAHSLGRRRQRASARALPRQRDRASASPNVLTPRRRSPCPPMWSSTRSGPTRRSGSASRPCTSCCPRGCRGSHPTVGRSWWSARTSAPTRSSGGSSSRAFGVTGSPQPRAFGCWVTPAGWGPSTGVAAVKGREGSSATCGAAPELAAAARAPAPSRRRCRIVAPNDALVAAAARVVGTPRDHRAPQRSHGTQSAPSRHPRKSSDPAAKVTMMHAVSAREWSPTSADPSRPARWGRPRPRCAGRHRGRAARWRSAQRRRSAHRQPSTTSAARDVRARASVATAGRPPKAIANGSGDHTVDLATAL